MKTNRPPHTLAPLLAAALLAPGLLSAATVTLEDFTGVPTGTLLTDVPRWTKQSGATDTATIQPTAGYSGQGATMNTVALYQYAIPTAEVMTIGSLVNGYSVKLQLSATNNYQQAQVLIGQNDGVNGLSVIFDGGTNNTDSDNSIKLSSGGTGWGSITYNTAANSQWQSDTWYQIDFTNIALVSSGYGSAVTGQVTITNLTTQTQLVSNQVVTGFGNAGTFNTINTVVIGNKATARQLNFDDITAATVPEPGAISLLIVAGLAFPFLYRRLRPAR